MPALLETVSRLPYLSGLPRDVAECTMWVGYSGSAPGDVATPIMEAWQAFWGSESTGMSAEIGTFISSIVDRAHCEVQIYIHETFGDHAGSPIVVPMGFPTPTSTSSLPLQDAVCTSYKGILSYTEAGVLMDGTGGAPAAPPASQKRGRMYVGPLNANVLTDSTAGYPLPSDGFMNNLTLATKAFIAAIDAISGCHAVVYSRPVLTGPHTRAGHTTPITAGWVDNRWDVQRRRAVDASSRVLWP